ncbi:hypothetical protein TKK_0009864 [Trichogramma kaykai]
MEWQKLHKAIISFLLLLYAEPAFPRSLVSKLVEFLHGFVHDIFLKSLEADILSICNSTSDKNELNIKIKDIFAAHGRVFENVLTGKDRFDFFKKKGFMEPKKYKIKNFYRESQKNDDDESVFEEEPISGVHIPLRHSLAYFLQIPGMFHSIINYTKELENDKSIIKNIVQTKFWANAIKGRTDYLIPLYVYFDEIEVGNPLGSHAGIQKFGVVHALIATLPPMISSRLSSIIFSTIFHSAGLKKSSNSEVFGPLINELKFLYNEGVDIIIDKKKNPICRASSQDCKTMYCEDTTKLRNINNYNEDLRASNKKITGITENCVFNDVPKFHIAVNTTVDIMHDMWEGVCMYVINAMLYEYIYVKKYFSLEKLNTWIKDFSYDVETNKPPKLTLNNQRQMLNIKYSASEMICLVKYLSLIIKDFVPKTGKHWEMFMELRNIVDIVLSPRIIDSHLLSLAASIKKLNTIWIELYDNLKPKFHFMTHYPTVISNFGPPVNYWAMRFESKHCDIKANAQATHSHRDLLHTISIKQSLQFAHYFNVTQAQQPDIFQLFSDNSNGTYTKIQRGDTIFNIESFIVLSLEESEALFAKIVKIEKNVYIKESDDLSKKKNG